MMQSDDLNTPLNEAEFEELDEFLLSLEHDDAILDTSEFDGFVTAVVSGPETIMPSTWLPVVWGGEDSAPEWTSVEEYQRIFGLMIRHLNTTSAALMQDPAEFEPCFMESTLEGVTHWIVDEWCHGYMKGAGLFSSLQATGPDMQDLVAPIRQFADPAGWDSLEGLSHAEVRRLQERIAPAARAIHRYWIVRRSPFGARSAPFVRPQPKVGRNDPCHCGSGRKYKKCCGAH
jgi:uncharacterized protein